jgi:glucodextranase-like protein/HYDIN/CFA65/VesB family protein
MRMKILFVFSVLFFCMTLCVFSATWTDWDRMEGHLWRIEGWGFTGSIDHSTDQSYEGSSSMKYSIGSNPTAWGEGVRTAVFNTKNQPTTCTVWIYCASGVTNPVKAKIEAWNNGASVGASSEVLMVAGSWTLITATSSDITSSFNQLGIIFANTGSNPSTGDSYYFDDFQIDGSSWDDFENQTPWHGWFYEEYSSPSVGECVTAAEAGSVTPPEGDRMLMCKWDSTLAGWQDQFHIFTSESWNGRTALRLKAYAPSGTSLDVGIDILFMRNSWAEKFHCPRAFLSKNDTWQTLSWDITDISTKLTGNVDEIWIRIANGEDSDGGTIYIDDIEYSTDYTRLKTIDGDPSDWTSTAPGTDDTSSWDFKEYVWNDASGDDLGDGDYSYPTHTEAGWSFSGTEFDIEEFRIARDDLNIYMLFVMGDLEPSEPDWITNVGATFNVKSGGQTDIWSFANTLTDSANAWETRITSTGGHNKISKFNPDSTTTSDDIAYDDYGGYAISNSNNCIEICMPIVTLGIEKFTTASLCVVTGGNDSGDMRAVKAAAEEWHGGGGSDTDLDPRIYDMVGSSGSNQYDDLDDWGTGWTTVYNSYITVDLRSPDVSSSSDTLNLGTVVEGSPVTLGINIENDGDYDLSVSSISITGGDAGAYQFDPVPSTPLTVNPGDSYTLNVKFSPSATTDYNDAQIQVNSDDPDESVMNINLLGSGLEAAPQLVDAYSVSATDIKVVFDKDVDQASGENAGNYSISGITINNATRDGSDHKIVTILASSSITGDTASDTLNVNGVQPDGGGDACSGESVVFYAGITAINVIQPNTATPFNSSYKVTLIGRVAGTDGVDQAWIADSAGMNSGIEISGAAFATGVSSGDEVTVVGNIEESATLTRLINPEKISSSANTAYSATVVNITDILDTNAADTAPAEQYEGVLVTVQDAVVVSPWDFSTSYDFALSKDGGANKVSVDDAAWPSFGSSQPVIGGAVYDITGIVSFAGGHFTLNPFSASDITLKVVPVELSTFSID